MKLDVTELATLDFECYYASDYTLRTLPTSEYVLHDNFKNHCVSIKLGLQPPRVYRTEGIAAALAGIDWSKTDLLAHNTAFDGFILTQRYGHTPRRYLDTLSMARGLTGATKSNTLGALAERLGLGIKNTAALLDTKGKTHLTDAEYEALELYNIQDVNLCFDAFVLMLRRGFPNQELDVIDHTIRMFCEPLLMVDTVKAAKAFDDELGRKAIALLKAGNCTSTQIMSNAGFANLLKIQGVTPPQKVSPTTGKHTWAFAKTDEGMKQLLESPSAIIRSLAQARLILKSTIGETRAQRLVAAGADDQRLPVLLNYCGAHTTRWSAGNKMNLQNLPRGGILRESIIAPPGYLIVAADASQIEARLNAWFADETDLLDAFRQWDLGFGPDVYKIQAARLFNVPVDQVTKDQRQVGKVMVLALGYGMGAEKFQTTALNGAPSVKLDIDLCSLAVKSFRGSNRHIAATWRSVWSIIAGMASGTPSGYKCITWGFEYILLPNGLKLYYPNLQLDFNGGQNATYENRGKECPLYGGLLVENIIQALARTIIAYHMLIIGAKYRIVTTTHDELVCCVPEEQAAECLAFMIETMRKAPSWAAGLPLNAEGFINTCYIKPPKSISTRNSSTL